MSRRMNLRRKHLLFDKNKKRSKEKLLFVLLSLLILTVILIFSYLNRVLSPFLEEYAQTEMKKISNLILNQSLSQEVKESMDVDDLYVVGKDENGTITSIDLNGPLVNDLLGKVTRKVSEDFQLVQEGKIDHLSYYEDALENTSLDQDALKEGIIFYIPTGLAFRNVFLSNLGPRVPVRFRLTGEVGSRVDTKITNYGINNALLEINLHVELTEMLLLPFSTSSVKVEADYLLGVKMMEGTVPDTYFSGIQNQSETVFHQVS